MRRYLPIVLAVLAAALAVPAAASGSADVTNANVTLRLARDSSVLVSERLTFDYEGTYHASYRDIPLPSGATIDANSIGVREGNRVYQPGGCTTFGCTDRTGVFGVTTTPDGSGVRIVWHHNASDQTRTFVVGYRLDKVVDAYDDVLDFNARVWGDQWDFSLDHLTAQLRSPLLDPANRTYQVVGIAAIGRCQDDSRQRRRRPDCIGRARRISSSSSASPSRGRPGSTSMAPRRTPARHSRESPRRSRRRPTTSTSPGTRRSASSPTTRSCSRA